MFGEIVGILRFRQLCFKSDDWIAVVALQVSPGEDLAVSQSFWQNGAKGFLYFFEAVGGVRDCANLYGLHNALLLQSSSQLCSHL
jgi:hypothetical protein